MGCKSSWRQTKENLPLINPKRDTGQWSCTSSRILRNLSLSSAQLIVNQAKNGVLVLRRRSKYWNSTFLSLIRPSTHSVDVLHDDNDSAKKEIVADKMLGPLLSKSLTHVRIRSVSSVDHVWDSIWIYKSSLSITKVGTLTTIRNGITEFAVDIFFAVEVFNSVYFCE